MSKKIQRAWVVFTDQTDLVWLRILKRRFRHCFVILYDGKNWMSVDPLSSHTEIAVQDVAEEFDLIGWLNGQGHIVLPVFIMHQSKSAPFMLFSCVEAVKRILGIHNIFIFTPWQLYRYLLRQSF